MFSFLRIGPEEESFINGHDMKQRVEHVRAEILFSTYETITEAMQRIEALKITICHAMHCDCLFVGGICLDSEDERGNLAQNVTVKVHSEEHRPEIKAVRVTPANVRFNLISLEGISLQKPSAGVFSSIRQIDI